MKIIENPLKPVTVWLLGIAAVVAGLEPFVPELEKRLPPHWFAVVAPLILIARLVQQGQAKPAERNVLVEVRKDDES